MKQILLLIILCLTLTFIWFHKGLIFAGGEEGIPFYNLEKTSEYYSSVWHETGIGFPAVNEQRIPIFSLLKIFYQLGIPGFLLQAFTFFLLMSVGTVSVFFLIKETVLKDLYENNGQKKYQYLPLIAGIFYLLNPFSMTQIWGRGLYMQFFPYALFPLFLILFILGIKKRNFLYGAIALISSVILSPAFDNISYAPSLWLIILLYTFFHLIKHFNKKEVIFTAAFFTFLFLGWVLLHLFWILPFLNLSIQPYAAITENPEHGLGSLRGVSRQYPLHVLIRLMHSGYFFEDLYGKIYSGFIFGIISWIIPLVSIFSVKKFKKLLHFQYFGVLFLIGLFISLGSNFPSGWLFELLFKYIPFFQMFRNPFEKFGLIFLIAYVPFFALGTLIVAQKISQLFKEKTARFLSIAIIIMLVCGIYVWPMWTGIFAGGYRLNPWVKVPDYYKEMKKWLDENSEDYRVFMTPLWSGDGTFYQWGNTRFQGTDPMVYLISQPAVSYSSQAPDFLSSMRKNMERINLAPSLALFRAKYLIDRGDALMITKAEKQHSKFLTGALYPPLGIDLSSQRICQDKYASSSINGTAWIICQMSDMESDWSEIKYAHFILKTDVPSFLEIAIRDKNGIRIRWYGPNDAAYKTSNSDWTIIDIPLSAPTEYNHAIDFSKVDLIEILAHPQILPKTSVEEIFLKEIILDPGKEEKLNNFRLVQTFGNLQVYEPLYFNSPPEFGSLSKLERVNSFIGLFDQVNKKRDSINTLGFILPSQNPDKDLDKLTDEASLKVLDKQKISDSRYWLEVNNSDGNGLIILSKTFDPQWKVISGIGKEMLEGNLFDDFSLLQRMSLDEKDHYVVNGYANLWKISGQDSQYAIVFMPQIFADIGWRVSIFSIILLGGFTLVWVLKKYTSLY